MALARVALAVGVFAAAGCARRAPERPPPARVPPAPLAAAPSTPPPAEQAPTPVAAQAPEPAGPIEGGRYQDLVEKTQSPPADKTTKTELACASEFLALSKEKRRETKPDGSKTCTQKEFEERMACYDRRERELASLSGDALWREATPVELRDTAVTRIRDAADAKISLTPAERQLYAVALLVGEVANGGIHQYYFNSAGDDAATAQAGLVRFGMKDASAIMQCSTSAFPRGKPSRDRDARNKQLARWGEKQFQIFATLTKAFFVVDDIEWDGVGTYVHDHPAEFPHART